jgi:hypothetical protein
VKPVDADRLDRLMDVQGQTSVVHKAAVRTDPSDGAARLDTAKDVLLSFLLELNRDRRLAKDPDTFEPPQGKRG